MDSTACSFLWRTVTVYVGGGLIFMYFESYSAFTKRGMLHIRNRKNLRSQLFYDFVK